MGSFSQKKQSGGRPVSVQLKSAPSFLFCGCEVICLHITVEWTAVKITNTGLECSSLLLPTLLLILLAYRCAVNCTSFEASVSASACLARYRSRLIFKSRLLGMSGTITSIRRQTPITKCYNNSNYYIV